MSGSPWPRRVFRALRHPARAVDHWLWVRYAPDASPLIQQCLDKGGVTRLPPGRWKIEHQLVVRAHSSLEGPGS